MSSFAFHFMASTSVSSIGITLILIVKNCFKRHLSVRGQYNLGFLYFALLAIPLIPRGFFSLFNIGSWTNVIINNVNVATTSSPSSTDFAVAYNNGWIQDFALAVDRSTPGYIHLILGSLWILGIIVLAAIALLCNRKLRLINESVKPIKDGELLSLFYRCKAEIGIKRNIFIGTSIIVNTPMTMGFFKPMIILPAMKTKPSDARYAILHELAHCKKRDIQVNSIMCLFQILFWFNPLVHIAFKRMRLDRELACDAFVLEMLPKEHRTDYGRALLNFVSEFSHSPTLLFTTNMGGSKPQIVSRIKHIASYMKETSLLRAKSTCIFVLMGILVMCKIPIVSVFANAENDIFAFRTENVIYSDLSVFFDGFEGSFVLYDLNEGAYTIHNRDMSVTRVSPNSTYKIFSAIIALEMGILDSDNTWREWDGTLHLFESWNQNHNLASAMQSSVNWYFQDFDRQVGIEQLYAHLSRLSYGNQNLSGGVMDFWTESSLRISPVEQVKLLRDLHQGNTIFEARHIDTIKDAILLSERDGSVLSGKTGTGNINGALGMNGWFVGLVETNGNTFFFATYIQGGSNAGGSAASLVTLAILEYKGIF
ncbi:MAG: BlaR1 family beta-lactam sensor/signal transducer [Defluviitaleaceae bacterium]|nr:BlaR1 family beta-lactam sensor/signal transducer [Defluviitaleaceae bacterium]